MKRFWLVGFALVTALALAPAAMADSFTINLSSSAVNNPTDSNFCASGVSCAPSISGSGTLIGTALGGGSYDITGTGVGGVTIVIAGYTYTASVIPNSSSPAPAYYTSPSNYYFVYDDVVTLGTSSPSVDQYGLLFSLSGSGPDASGVIDFYSSGPTGSSDVIWWDLYLPTDSSLNDPNYPNDDGFPYGGAYGEPLDNFAINPEPSSFLLFGTGLLGLAAFVYRRRQTA